jgi:hypothetical protein
MKNSLLVDTSVWIDFFRGVENTNVQILTEYLTEDDPVFICPIILQEILQGIRTEKQFNEIKEYLLCLNILNEDSIESALGAADLFRKLRKKGITIRKSNDCLIAWYAIKYSLNILHKDRDFDQIVANL